jgi:hypothetical protein
MKAFLFTIAILTITISVKAQTFSFRLPPQSQDGPIGYCIIEYDKQTFTGQTSTLPKLVVRKVLEPLIVYFRLEVQDYGARSFICIDGNSGTEFLLGPFIIDDENLTVQTPRHQFYLPESGITITALWLNDSNFTEVATFQYDPNINGYYTANSCPFNPDNFQCLIPQRDQNVDSRTSQNNLSKIEVYPNPANDKINVSINSPDYATEIKIVISNSNGKLIHEENINRELNEIAIDHLSTGIYFYSFFNLSGELLLRGRILKMQ